MRIIFNIISPSLSLSLQTLDLLQRLCEDRGYDFLRLDGKTPTSKRQSLVDRFNDKYCKICKCVCIFIFMIKINEK